MYEPSDGDHLFAGAFNALTSSIEGVGVAEGCGVTVGSGTLDASDTLSVSSGQVDIDGPVNVSSQSVGVSSVDSGGVRYTAVVVDGSGSAKTVDGTEDTSEDPRPVAPNAPDGNVLLAYARVTDAGLDALFDLRVIRETTGGVTHVSTTKPAGLKGDTWVDPDNGVYSAYYNSEWHPIPPVQSLQETSTFTDSDVTVTPSGNAIDDAVRLRDGLTDTIGIDDHSTNTNTSSGSECGAVFEPSMLGTSIDVYVDGDNQTDGSMDAVLYDHSDGTELDRTSIGSVGQKYTLNGTMQPGNQYRVVLASTASWYPSQSDITYDYPVSGDQFDIVDGWRGGSTIYLWCFTQFELEYNEYDESPTVMWDQANLDSWDIATYYKTDAGGNVTVDVIDGNGNTLYQNIDQNFDISTVDSSKNVGLRVNLSRDDPADDPRLDYAARRMIR